MAKTAGTSGQGSTAEPGIPGASVPGVDANDPFGVAGWMKDKLPGVPMHPLMAHPTAAVAAATALGFGITSHVAGMMFGVMQGAMETLQKSSAEGALKPAAAKPDAKVAETNAPAQAKPKAVRPVLKIVPASGPATGADLKLISGIGPKLEQALNRLGIASVADMAGWSAAKVAKVDEQLGLGGRIARDDWVGQAKRLLQG